MQPFDPVAGDYVVTSFAANGIEGELISVRTDRGTRVNAWRCVEPAPDDPHMCYFAHGHSLETFEPFGYSVLAGSELQKVLADERTRLGELRPGGDAPKLRRNDLLVWWSGSEAPHSVIVEVPVFDATGRLNEQATFVSSKPGTGAVRPAVSLAVVKIDHRSATRIEAWR